MERTEANRLPPLPADPRMRASRERVLAAAAAILERDGYTGLAMERVAAESGVAKTTLYRQWPTKAALCMDIYLAEAGRELHDPDTGDVGADLKALVNAVVRLQTRTVAGRAFLGLIAEAQINPASREAFLAEFAERRRELTRKVLRRAVERGQVRRDLDIDLAIDVIGGAVTFRLLQGHAPLSPRFAASLVALFLAGAAPRP
jgi:AcrR family transcriptional regulator